MRNFPLIALKVSDSLYGQQVKELPDLNVGTLVTWLQTYCHYQTPLGNEVIKVQHYWLDSRTLMRPVQLHGIPKPKRGDDDA
jgi:hypothetical protein